MYICLNICNNHHQSIKTKKEYIQLLWEYLDNTARKYGVTRMGLLDSVARGEQMDDSDSILLRRISQYLRTYPDKGGIRKMLGCKVDIIRLYANMTNTLFGNEVEKISFMFDKLRIKSLLQSIEGAISLIRDNTLSIRSANDFLTSSEGMFVLERGFNLLYNKEACPSPKETADFPTQSLIHPFIPPTLFGEILVDDDEEQAIFA